MSKSILIVEDESKLAKVLADYLEKDDFKTNHLINGDEVVECGIKEGLKIVDLTGAGDLFAAGFLHGYLNNMSLKESLDKGTEMSSKVIQQIGARL